MGTAGTAGPTSVTDPTVRAGSRTGLVVALVSAAAFGTSGAFGSALISAGWSPSAVVLIRVALAAAILAVPAGLALRGHRGILARSRGQVMLFGIFGVACAQVCYFYAVSRLSVGVALMLEYLGVILVVLWMWLRHGRRPRGLTLLGSAVAVAGLALVLDVVGGFRIDPVGVLWGLGAAVGLAVFFVISSRSTDAVPPVAMAGLGLGVGAVVLLLLGLSGVMPLAARFEPVAFAGTTVPWWLLVLGISVIAAVVAYVVGIVAARMLGATMASFIGLTEVLFAVIFAWLLLGELPTAVQLAGGVLIVAGVAMVRIDELRRARRAASLAD